MDDDDEEVLQKTCVLYDVKKDQWIKFNQEMNVARAQSSVVVTDTHVYVIGADKYEGSTSNLDDFGGD